MDFRIKTKNMSVDVAHDFHRDDFSKIFNCLKKIRFCEAYLWVQESWGNRQTSK